MAHRTMVNGTNYDIIGGRTRVNSTDYDVVGGRTMVNGTDYSIEFAKEQEPVPAGKVGVTIQAFDPPCGEIEVNGESLSTKEDGVYIYDPGVTVSITGAACNIVFNGEMVAELNTSTFAPTRYTFSLTTNVTVYSGYDDGAVIYVETE